MFKGDRVIQQTNQNANLGSCIADKCEKLGPNEVVSELNYTRIYPGYSGCLNSCGGAFCGCFLPKPACWFYRITHKPLSNRIFEVIQCPHWTPSIKLAIEITIAKKTIVFTETFRPYVTEEMANFNITVSSIQRPAASLETTRFAISANSSYLLPRNFQLPIACDNPIQALSRFDTCSNRMRCNCGTSVRTCQCPADSIRVLDHNETKLPLSTPYGTITFSDNDISAISDQEEFVLRVESKLLVDSVELITRQKCELTISELKGCYDCTLGARLTVVCNAQSNSTVTVTCDTQEFLLKCGPSNEENTIALHFDQPSVHEKCNAHCSENPTKFLLNGTLFYHVIVSNMSVFESRSHSVPIHHQWFSDISLPNTDPLIHVIKDHWRLTLAAVTSIVVLSGLTYLAGPLVLLSVLSLVSNLVVAILKLIWTFVLKVGCNQKKETISK